MIARSASFAAKKNEANGEEDGPLLLLSEVLEQILLQHYFLLTMRKSINETIDSFWNNLDTYTLYQLLEWIHEVIEVEEDMRNNPEKYRKGRNQGNSVEDDPETLDLYQQMRSMGG